MIFIILFHVSVYKILLKIQIPLTNIAYLVHKFVQNYLINKLINYLIKIQTYY
jgi:hypothetical protein